MAVRFDTVGDFLNRTASVPPNNAAFTFMGWVYIVTDLAATGTMLFIGDAVNVNAQVGVDNSLNMRIADTDFGGGTTGDAIGVGAWNHIAWVRSAGAVHSVFLNGVAGAGTLSASGTLANSSPQLRIGQDLAAQRINGRVEAVKFWTAALTAPQIVAEMPRYDPVVTANNWGWWPLTVHTDLTDHSANARNFTANGTLTTEAGPGGITDGAGGTTITPTEGSGVLAGVQAARFTGFVKTPITP